MAVYQDIQARQIWADPVHFVPHCEGYRLPFPGTLTLNDSETITLTQDAIYQTACATAGASATSVPNSTLVVYGLAEPFEASVVPQMFVLGAMLVIAWSLVVILVITPRTSFVLGTGVGHLGRATGNSATVISVGGRPWLQKFAAFTVAVSLFIATVNSFKIVEQQYNDGYEDAAVVTNQVVNSYEVRIMRVISTTFVWLAQVQTLIRLFPRHQEKVIIKWAGFGLIILDTLFVILNNFVANGGTGPKSTKPRAYTEVIPALSYLFEVALNLLYAAWVLYYSFVKRRLAFYHPQMRNIAVVALLSYTSVLIPVVFFTMDIAKPQLASWGDYIRWVGSAAASVVVWEWVERIEALEREERKNGILGREIFDGDETFGRSTSLKFKWPRSRSRKKEPSDFTNSSINTSNNNGDSTGSPRTPATDGVSTDVQLLSMRSSKREDTTTTISNDQSRRSLIHTFRPPVIESPVSRADTTSAASTVYAVIHHPSSSSTTPAQDQQQTGSNLARPEHERSEVTELNTSIVSQNTVPTRQPRSFTVLPSINNPFKRRRSSPPPEISRATTGPSSQPSQTRWNNLRRSRHGFRLGRSQALPVKLPVVVVPAQPRGHIWTPPPETGNKNPMDQASQEPSSDDQGSNHTPMSLDQSIQNIHDATSRMPDVAVDKDGQVLTSGHGSEHTAIGHSVTTQFSDRAQSPRTLLPRVDEDVEHLPQRPNNEGDSHGADITTQISIPPAG